VIITDEVDTARGLVDRFSVKSGAYQIEVSYRDELKTGWTVIVQKVTPVPQRGG
jgi:hypothetical protein